MKVFILPIQVFFFSLFLYSCGSGGSNESDKVDESPSIIPKEEPKDIKSEEKHVIEFEDGNIQELTEKTYRDGSIWTLFKVNNEIIFEKKYELPTSTYPQELLKFKEIIDYRKSFVRDDATYKEFKNKYKISDSRTSLVSNRSDQDFSPEEKERVQRELKEKFKDYRERKFKERQTK
jgi:hypothetical protein